MNYGTVNTIIASISFLFNAFVAKILMSRILIKVLIKNMRDIEIDLEM